MYPLPSIMSLSGTALLTCQFLEGVWDAVYVLKAQIELINKNFSKTVQLFLNGYLYYFCAADYLQWSLY